MSNECHCLEDLRSGDLLIFAEDGRTGFSAFALGAIRFFTRSEYAHVGIAVRNGDDVCILDAVVPSVQYRKLRKSETFYFVPMHLNIVDGDLHKVVVKYRGLKYSVLDAFRAYFGLTLKDDNRYQCVELVDEIYREQGLDLNVGRLTPSNIVKAALSRPGTTLRRHVAN